MPRVDLSHLLRELHGILAEAAVHANNNDLTRLFATVAAAAYARASLHMIGTVAMRAPKRVGCFMDDTEIHVESPIIDMHALLTIDKQLALVVRGSRFNQMLCNDPRFKCIQQQVQKILIMYRIYSKLCGAIQQRDLLGVRVLLVEYMSLFLV